MGKSKTPSLDHLYERFENSDPLDAFDDLVSMGVTSEEALVNANTNRDRLYDEYVSDNQSSPKVMKQKLTKQYLHILTASLGPNQGAMFYNQENRLIHDVKEWFRDCIVPGLFEKILDTNSAANIMRRRVDRMRVHFNDMVTQLRKEGWQEETPFTNPEITTFKRTITEFTFPKWGESDE
jgi:hypothetical protein